MRDCICKECRKEFKYDYKISICHNCLMEYKKVEIDPKIIDKIIEENYDLLKNLGDE